jgi:cell division protein FtsB
MPNAPSGRGSDPRKRSSSAGPRTAGRRPAGATSVGARPFAGPRRGPVRQRSAPPQGRPARPRFTGRAAILVLVLALLVMSYASSMRAYLQQRSDIAELRASIVKNQAAVDRLSREKKRWHDPAYVQSVAHQRFGWVLPGEIGFQVLDDNGKPMDHTDSLSAPSSVAERTRPLWWQSAWGSVVASGRPVVDRSDVPPPARKIVPHKHPGH